MDVIATVAEAESEAEKTAKHSKDEKSARHGEIIIKVPKDNKVRVKATDSADTIVSNIHNGEVIIRNIDTNLVLSVCHGRSEEISDGDFVEMTILGQAYIKDLSGVLKVNQFKGIIVIKTEH